MVVVDSDGWINYLRTPDSPTGSALQALLDANQVVMVGVVLAEILQGARTEREYSTLFPRLDAVPYQETSKQSWAAAGQIAAQLRWSGNTSR
jgi:predicted nucleic acid-binding protein